MVETDHLTIYEIVTEAQKHNLESQERLKHWTNTHQLIKDQSVSWKDNQLVVARDNDLKRGVI